MNALNMYLYTLIISLLFGCNSNHTPEVSNFNALSNIDSEVDTIEFMVDMSDVILNGIQIPSIRQTPNGSFTFSFNIKNTTSTDQSFYYKIYYLNDSYKMTEEYAHENFYGSWVNVSDTFRLTSLVKSGKKISCVDSFKIAGNPRDEKIYYGVASEHMEITREKVHAKMENIVSIKEWYADIKKKAKASNTPVNDQLFKDALWVLNNDRNTGNTNHRWKRNPRMGNYRFMLVIVTKDKLATIASEVRNIGRKNVEGKFVDPFLYFEKLPPTEGVVVVHSSKVLKTKALLDVNNGVYVNLTKLENYNADFSNSNKLCGFSSDLFRKAHYEQFFHNINKKLGYKNIPVTADVISENYSRELYSANEKKYAGTGQLITGRISNSECPCKTVKVDTLKHAIELRNPGYKTLSKYEKQNVGIRSRIGFTYGKVRYKIKFPELINKENIWNGITNAAWMIYQDESEWNQRRICPGTGYIKETDSGKNEVRSPVTNYSEIDIEIVKESVHWSNGYGPKVPAPTDGYNAALSDDIMVTCTNFDRGCREPKNMDRGAHIISNNGKAYVLHRWDYWYVAVTHKHPEKDDELFKGDYYYFEIDWQPTQIIWRVGGSPDKMRQICYMDNTVTSVPNNQMTPIITQEYHYADWWPTSPYKQDYIPFPQNDINGYIYEITVE